MTQGIYIHFTRPRTKKQLREALKTAPESVYLQATSVLGNEYDGLITRMPIGKTVYIVGPSPYDRRWYASLTRWGDNNFKLS